MASASREAGASVLVKRVRELEGASRTREAGSLEWDPRSSVKCGEREVATIEKVNMRRMAVSSIAWLDRNRPLLDGASVTNRKVELGQALNRPKTMLGVLVANGRSKLTQERATIGDNENVPSRNDLEKI